MKKFFRPLSRLLLLTLVAAISSACCFDGHHWHACYRVYAPRCCR